MASELAVRPIFKKKKKSHLKRPYNVGQGYYFSCTDEFLSRAHFMFLSGFTSDVKRQDNTCQVRYFHEQ